MTLAKTGSETVLYTIQKELIKKQFFDEREKEKMIDEITNRVLSRIHLTLDTSDAKKELSELKKEIENLINLK
ncbi:MAG: hypothetical protein E7482_03340 [Ruminococcaceae bacterium]|nr:hypothetical protein [Oscillospiraceae bacterium]